MRLVWWLSLFGVCAGAQTYQVPVANFAENVGQLDAGVLFGIDSRRFLRDRVQLSDSIWLIFEDSNATSIQGQEAQPFRVNDFRGVDSRRWRSNVPYFDALSYSNLHPGINAVWRRDGARLTLRLVLRPGATLDRLRFRVVAQPSVNLSQDIQGNVWVNGFSNRFLAPVVSPGNATGAKASFAIVEPDLFVLRAESYDAGLPLIVDITVVVPSAQFGTEVRAAAVDSSNRVILAGLDYFTRLRADGAADFLTLFTGGLAQYAAVDRQGNHVLAGISIGGFSVTPGAPQTEYGGGDGIFLGDLFLARFDALGNLTASTYFGGAGEDRFLSAAVGANGDVYIGGSGTRPVPTTPGSYRPDGPGTFVVRWTPGQPRFTFSTYLPTLSPQIGVDAAGNVAFSGTAGPTTPGVLEPAFIRRPQIYVGKLDATGSRLIFGTYVPLGPPSEITAQPESLVVHPTGTIWAAASIRHPEGFGNVLVALSAEGTRLLYSESSPVIYVSDRPNDLALDGVGNVLVFGRTTQMSHFTSLEAPLRGGCRDDQSVYYRKLGPQGQPLYATYLSGWISAFDSRGWPYLSDNALSIVNLRLFPLEGRAPEIACVVNSAGRQPQASGEIIGAVPSGLAPGEFVTIIGSGLPADSKVRFDGMEVPVTGAQPGLLTVRVPESVRGSTEIQAGSAPSVRLTVIDARFALFTADGHGRGPAAAFFPDGSQNSAQRPAGPGDVLTVYGTGAGAGLPITLLFGGWQAVIEYAGPAPGFPGVSQVNFRVPDTYEQGPMGQALVRVLSGPVGRSFPEPRTFARVR